MMTPKEKAEELVKLYQSTLMLFDEDIDSKKCAIIAVDEILDAITFNMYDEEEYNKVRVFWEQVKFELQRLN
jgi:hypothetical protein